MTNERRLWSAVFVGVLILPMLLAVASPVIEEPTKLFIIMLGMTAYMGMALQVILAARLPAISRALGIDLLIRLHRYMGVLLLGMVLVHVAMFLLRRPEIWKWFLIYGQEPKAYFGVTAFWGMLLLAVTSIWRARLGLTYERWRMLHLVFSSMAMFGGYLHMITAGDFISWTPIRIMYTTMLVLSVAAVVHVRFGRAFAATGTPYRLAAVRPERGSATTLDLVADGHPGIAFKPGDFAWLRIGRRPYAITEHPFSVASSTVRRERIEFTCKASGDTTSTLDRLTPGTTVYVDGPHGVWRMQSTARGIVLVTAGIGITPAMSIIRTLADQGRTDLPITLVHGARTLDDLTFREELEARVIEMPNLRIVPVLSRPHSGWDGQHGRIDTWHVQNLVAPLALDGHEVFTCGPGTMVDAVLDALHTSGVPSDRVHAERFEGV